MVRKLSISSAVRKFGHFQESSRKERLQVQEESLWDLLPVFASRVSFADSTDACSLWAVYSAIVVEYLQSAAMPENYAGLSPASTSSPSHRRQSGVFPSDTVVDRPDLTQCYGYVRELAQQFVGVRCNRKSQFFSVKCFENLSGALVLCCVVLWLLVHKGGFL